MLNANQLVGTHDLLFITLDTLRFDVARDCLRRGQTPNLASVLGPEGWQPRHSPGNFTYAAHQAFFAGFLPTPITHGKHPRLFALRFPGSETTVAETCVLDGADIVTGLAERGYHTACIGGVGFFNKLTPLGRVLPGLFQESHWNPDLGVTARDSTRNQVMLAEQIIARLPVAQRLFLFVNISAIHQPNCHYMDGAACDNLQTHAAALRYVDGELPPLFEAFKRRGPTMCIVCSDHGTAYGEDDYWGHRVGHASVWTVPYAEFLLPYTPLQP